MSPWGDGLPGGVIDAPPGGWGDGLPLGPADIVHPQLSGAYNNGLGGLIVCAYYDSVMKHANPANADDALNPANYSIPGAVIDSVTFIGDAPNTTVYLNLSGYLSSVNYTLTVSNVESGAGVVIDPAHNTASFWGPTHVVSVAKIDDTHFYLTYDAEMQHLGAGIFGDSLEPSNYTISGGLNVASVSLIQASPTIINIETDAKIEEGSTYTITVNILTIDINGMWIDLLRREASVYLPYTQAHRFVAEILIGNEVVWSQADSLQQQTLALDVRRFMGKLPLTLRIRGFV